MNLEKRRRTIVVNRDFVHRNSWKPLLENMEPLKPEYKLTADARLFEMTLKKRLETDKIPVTIAVFGKQSHFFSFAKTFFILYLTSYF